MTKPPIQIVDENDHIIGHKLRGTLDYENDIYRVSALWLKNSNGAILIAKRTISKDRDAGLWGPAVAGTLDEGETYESNIYKEAIEEIGLHDVKFSTGPKVRIRKPRNYFCQWFTATVDLNLEDFIMQTEEVDELAWVAKQKLIDDVATNPQEFIPTMTEILKLMEDA